MKKKSDNPLISDDSVNAILTILTAFRQSKVLLSACELDIFTIIGNDQKNVKEIAISAGTEEKATGKLLNALVAMQLLIKHDDKYQNTKGTRRFLVKGRPEYIGNMMFMTAQFEKWMELTDCIRTGKAVSYQDIEDKPKEWIRDYVDSVYWRSKMQIPDIVSMVNLRDINSLLDLGCGSASYAMEFKRIKPEMKVTAFDLPKIIYEANKHIEREDMVRDINLMSGDFMKDDFGKGYDAIFLSDVMSHFSFGENTKLMHRVYDALARGGKLIVHDTFINDERLEPVSATFDSLGYLINTEGGDVFTESDIWMILKEGWFGNIKMITTPFNTSIFIAEK